MKKIKYEVYVIVIITLMVVLSGCSQKTVSSTQTLIEAENNILLSTGGQGGSIPYAIKEKVVSGKANKVEKTPETRTIGEPDKTQVQKVTKEVSKEKSNKAAQNLEKKPAVKPASGKKIAYLTFDDCSSENTIRILDTLKRYEIKATFFPNVNIEEPNIEFDKQMIKRMIEEGHAIGNHTYSHDYSQIYTTVENFIADVNRMNDFIFEAAGVKTSLLRFPGGSNNRVSWKYGGQAFMPQLIPKMKELGYTYFDWNVSSTDAALVTVPKEAILKRILDGAANKKSAIILMHQSKNKTTTAEALPEVIEGLRAMQFAFDKLSQSSFNYQFTK